MTSYLNEKRSIRAAIIPGSIFVALLWIIKIIESQTGVSLHQFGVYPGAVNGILGIVTGPLVHGSFEHLASNSLALLLLMAGIFYGYPKSSYPTLAIIWIGSGLGTWLFAREAWHYGASGLTHGLFFFLLLISILRRDKRSIALMMIAFFMYGGMTMTIFPREAGISFEYHLFGAISGMLAALLFRKTDAVLVEKKYAWELEDNEDEVIGEQWRTDVVPANPPEQDSTEDEEKQPKLH